MDSDWISCKVSKTLIRSAALPNEDAKIKIKAMGDGQSCISITMEKTKKYEEIPCNQCRAVTRPKNATAKRFIIDLVNHINLQEIAFSFNKTDDLKKCFDAIAAVVGEAATKKTISKSLTKPTQAPEYPSQKISNATSQSYAPTLSTTPRRTTAIVPLSGSIQEKGINARQPTGLHATQPGSSKEPSFTIQQSMNADPSMSRKRNHKNQEDDDNPYGYVSSNEKNVASTETKKQKRIDDGIAIGPPLTEFCPENVKPTSSWHSETMTPRRNAKLDDDSTNIKMDDSPVNRFKSDDGKLSSYDIYRHRCMANLGNSCYMNASLQALASLPQFITELVKAVPEEKYRIDCQPRRSAILHAIVNIFDHIFGIPEDKFSKVNGCIRPREIDGPVPRELLKAMREAAGTQIDASMGESTQHDAQEFLSRLLEIIEEEIDGKISPQEERPASDKENYSADNLSNSVLSTKQKIEENSAVLPSFTHIIPKSKSVINPGSLFKITCINRLVCNDCGFKVNKEETDREVQLGMRNNEPTMADLIRMQFERHDIPWKCTSCESTRASMSTSFKDLPEYLIIVLKRYGYDEDTGGNKSTKTVKVDRDLYLQMLCEGSDYKTKELERIPQIAGYNEEQPKKEHNEAEVVPESPEAAPSPPDHPRGFKTPVKSVSRKLFPNSTCGEAESQDSQRSKSIFGDDEEVDKDASLRVEHDLDNDRTPEPTKEIAPASPSAIADKLADSNVFSKLSDDDPYNDVDSLKQSGGAVLNVENKNNLSKMQLERRDSEDSAVIIDEKKCDNILWKPLTSTKIIDSIKNIDSDLSNSTARCISGWIKRTIDNKQRSVPMSLPRGAFNLSPVEGDGACLFRCFSWWLFEGSQEHHDILRRTICDFIQKFHEEFSALAKSNWSGFENVENYLSFMRQDNEWGTHLEISAMATLLRCTIYSYHNKAWHKFPPKFAYIKKNTSKGYEYEKSEEEIKDETTSQGAMYIFNYKNHFDPVCSINEKAPPDSKDTEQEDSMEIDFNLDNCRTPPPQVSDHEEEENDAKEDIQQGPYIYNESDGPVYTLSAVVNHKGNFLNHGHYTAYSFDSDRNTWLNCDDSSVTVISEKVVLTQSKSSGYLFIYRRRHPNDEAQFKC